MHVNAAVGSDNPLNSDCLATGTGACATFQNAINIVQQYFDPASGTIQADCESVYQELVTISASGNGYLAIQLNGNPTTPANCAWMPNGISGTIISVQDFSTSGVSGFTFGFTGGASGTFIQSRQYAIVDLGNLVFSANPGGIDLQAVTNATISTIGTITLNNATGGALGAVLDNAFLHIGLPITVQPSSAASFTSWFIAANNSSLFLNSTITLGAGAVASGQRFSCDTNSVISQSGVVWPTGVNGSSVQRGCVAF